MADHAAGRGGWERPFTGLRARVADVDQALLPVQSTIGTWHAIKLERSSMGFLKRTQRIWTGRVLKDYGTIGDRAMARGLTRRALAVVLSDHGGPRLFIRESWRGFGFRTNFIELDRDEAMRLRDIIDDALAKM